MHISGSNASQNSITTYPAIAGYCLSQLRESAGISQATFAAKLGMSQSAWSRVEKGQTTLNIEQLRRAAVELNSSPSELVRQFDKLEQQLRSKGVGVAHKGEETNVGQFVAGAALSALLMALLTSR